MIELKKLQNNCRLHYLERLSRYEYETKMLEAERKAFYAQHPNFPIDSLFMVVSNPPKEFKITIID